MKERTLPPMIQWLCTFQPWWKLTRIRRRSKPCSLYPTSVPAHQNLQLTILLWVTRRVRDHRLTLPCQKRLSLSTDRYSSIFAQSAFHVTNNTWNLGTVQKNPRLCDDWVQQTDSLTIDSPTILDSAVLPPQNTYEPDTSDKFEQSIVCFLVLSQFATLFKTSLQVEEIQKTPPASIIHFSSNPSEQSSEAHPFLPTPPPLEPQSMLSSHPHVIPPATSPDASVERDLHLNHPNRRIPSPNISAITPLSSWSANMSVANSRRQRFTMGPRRDCEKCRLGVKGHWMHFD